jgi:hypothetical protein
MIRPVRTEAELEACVRIASAVDHRLAPIAAQLAWASERGYEELTTTTGVTNTALRAQKAKLGYEEKPGPILVRGAV